MPARLEIALKDHLTDAEGEGLRQKALTYFGIELSRVRTVQVITIDAELSAEQLVTIQREIFTNPVIQFSSFEPLDIPSDWIIWVGLRPGVRDNPGSTAMEAVQDILNLKFDAHQAIYASKRYCIQGEALMPRDLEKIAGELLANDIIQQRKIFSADQWDAATGIGHIIPKVMLDHVPTLTTIPVDSDQALEAISSERNLALNPNDIYSDHPHLFYR
jgi:phosphoribosylformylglycinamidine synthase